ncbi:hypothetical protein WJX81_005171 [Elliptochloris bilobata]|uniref:RRM domain-containing protein n=1 Tax=Elliptochloris bilobata TaxID=381761 RepID=A0AAW1S7Q3_9CHLO
MRYLANLKLQGSIVRVHRVEGKLLGAASDVLHVCFRSHAQAANALESLQSQSARLAGAFSASWVFGQSLTPCLAVGNLSADVTGAALQDGFQAHGALNALVVPAAAASDVACGFVWLESEDEAQRAIKAMKGARVGQWPINVVWAASQQRADAEAEMARMMADRADPDNTYVYVGNLSQQVGEAELVRVFARFGAVHSVARARALDFGVVRFLQHGAAVAAIAGLNGAFLRERAVIVKWGSAAPAAATVAAEPMVAPAVARALGGAL